MTTIKDSVHDHITVEGVAGELLDTPAVQRLRRVAQLGTVSLVYPSANHSRFEHSLGVYHLACRALEQLGIDGQRAERVRAAAMLHDVGHGPYSHNVEAIIARRTGKYHDDVAGLLARGEINDVLTAHGLDSSRVADLISGTGKLGQLIAGELDVDRMDYLVRDAHHTGVPYGTIDTERLVRSLRFERNQLVLEEGNVQTAESLLLARSLMNPAVYGHHAARVSKAMLRRATEGLLEAGARDGETLRRMDDAELLVALRTEPETRTLATRLAERDLFKRAVWAELPDVPENVITASHDEIRGFERSIASRADAEPDSVVVDVPAKPTMRESTTRVLVNGEVRRLDQQSALVSALRTAQREQWRFGVYTPPGDAERVGRAAESVLGLETDGALVSHVSRPTGHTTLDQFEQ